MTVRTAPCDWPISFSSCTSCEPLFSLPASGIAVFEEMATAFLWNWTGQRLGVCEVTVRPCRDGCTEGMSTYYGSGPYPSAGLGAGPWRPVIISGQWYNLGCARCGDTCSCTHTPAISLPGPVDSITAVTIDGEVLAESAYRVDNHKILVRTDGDEWPSCQDLSAAAGEPGTWTITYEQGIPVPMGGRVAAGLLACELAKAACGDGSCGLPQRVQTITRQGVTVAMLDAFDDIDTGHTGIWVIDSWVASMMKPKPRSRVYSPDIPRPSPRRTTFGG